MLNLIIEKSPDVSQDELVRCYIKTFSTQEGKTVLADLLNDCGMLRSSYYKDANDTFYNEGMRSVAIRILSIINTDPNSIVEEGQSTEDNDVI